MSQSKQTVPPRPPLLSRVVSRVRFEFDKPRLYAHAQRTIPCACRLCHCPAARGRRYSFVYVREDLQLLYYDIPKAASTAIRHAVFQDDHGLSMRDPERDESEYFTFTFVRNPWSRMVSNWAMFSKQKHRIKQLASMTDTPPRDFASFIDFALRTPNHHWQPQSLYVPTNVQFIGRIENYGNDFARLCERVGFEPYPVLRSNRTKHKHYTEYYTPEFVDRVGEAYRDDVQRFGYEFDPR